MSNALRKIAEHQLDQCFHGLTPLTRDELATSLARQWIGNDGNAVYVAYAKQGEGIDEQAGAGFGFVDRYTGLGREPERIASRGTLNAPWGLAIAPASFGRFAGDLLVGNFGDGRISAFHDDDVAGLLRGTDGTPIVIDGLWALLPGTATVGGTDSVLFSAGPDDESHGLVGKLTPAG